MPLERQLESEKSVEALAAIQIRKARETANGWLSRLSPLLGREEITQAETCRKRLALLEILRPDGEVALAELQQHATSSDTLLLETLQQALDELDGIEHDLRRHLAKLAPGDPQGAVDLELLRAKLAGVAARREVASVAGPLQTQTSLEGKTLTVLGSEPASGQALVVGGMGIVWLAFITYQAFQTFRTFGTGTLDNTWFTNGMWALLWLGGAIMVKSAIQLGSREELTLEGRKLTLRQRIGPFQMVNQHSLELETRAQHVSGAQAHQDPGVLAIRESNGKWLNFGRRRPVTEQLWLRDKINAYLETLPSDQTALNGGEPVVQ